MDFNIGYRDSLPTLQTFLTQSDGSYLDLSNASGINFLYQLRSKVNSPFTGNCSVIGLPTTGFVQYQFPQDNLSGGFYIGIFKVNYSGVGSQITIPNAGPILFAINNQIN